MDMGMNMSSSSSNSSMPLPASLVAMTMLPFHTQVGYDMVWFQPWMPASAASTFGACIGLFFLGAFYRFLNALRASVDLKWQYEAAARRAILKGAEECCEPPPGVLQFNWKTDVPRGLLEGLQSFVGYFLMLAVMVMNAWFFIAIILGIIVGETFFGRYAARGIEKLGQGC